MAILSPWQLSIRLQDRDTGHAVATFSLQWARFLSRGVGFFFLHPASPSSSPAIAWGWPVFRFEPGRDYDFAQKDRLRHVSGRDALRCPTARRTQTLRVDVTTRGQLEAALEALGAQGEHEARPIGCR